MEGLSHESSTILYYISCQYGNMHQEYLQLRVCLLILGKIKKLKQKIVTQSRRNKNYFYLIEGVLVKKIKVLIYLNCYSIKKFVNTTKNMKMQCTGSQIY